LCSPIDLLLAKPKAAQPEGNLLPRGFGEDLVVWVLEHIAHLASNLPDRPVADVSPAQQNLTAAGAKQPIEVLRQGALA